MHTYEAPNGTVVRFERLPRPFLDAFTIDYPEPVPPTREVDAFGGAELLPDYDDPDYQLALFQHRAGQMNELLELILTHCDVEILEEGDSDEELQSLGFSAFMLTLGGMHSLQAFVGEVFYWSTVTPRAMEEAARLFNVTWLGEFMSPIRQTRTRDSEPLGFGQAFYDFLAAVECGLTWKQFCKLDGPQQSMYVTFYYYKLKVRSL